MSDKDKRSRFSGLRRIGGFSTMGHLLSAFLPGRATVDKAFRPKRFDRRGFHGRDPDGGISRFRVEADKLSAREVEESLWRWERERGLYSVFASAAGAAFIGSWVFDFMSWQLTVGLAFAALIFITKSFVADFRAWQIIQGRFGSLAEYANHRLPRNMQIIEKD
ncbi:MULTISPECIES: hypothetical protein [unclassified Aurantimonas]|uniref:hypothetical protein n=1 Tax=unclassified Aurantimonas TaxID=2638230 RepID=UPI002E186D45|nr:MULTISPECIES: hypothetical protein [unclassified Aurantimonas]MEC5291932.1 hypothetical protein [Aurantimonas sp. C2-3-R2]MEC5413018.1 hypothetical protein [Aurantimonas sp. C2-4-R8]